MNILKNKMLYILIIFLAVADQFLKFFIVDLLYLYEQIPVIEGFFYITYVKNTGGAFSLLSQRSWGIYLLSALSIIIVILLLYAINRFSHDVYRWVRVAIAVLCGGAIGNLVDRVLEGAVVDYLMFVFGSYTFPIFNLADICIVVASVSLAIMLIFDKRLLHHDDSSDASKDELEHVPIEEQGDAHE